MADDFPIDDTAMVWMRFDNGVPGQLPAAAAELWEKRGWVRCDPPPEVDPVLPDHHQPPPAPAAADKKPTKGVKTDA